MTPRLYSPAEVLMRIGYHPEPWNDLVGLFGLFRLRLRELAEDLHTKLSWHG